MSLGVVLHSSQVFNPEQSWVIYSPLSVSLANPVIEIIHTFRMPAFFMVSGFFCLFSIRHYGEEMFLKIRCERVLVPLIMTALTLNSIQAYILAQSGWRHFDMHEYVNHGLWDSHLWFLNYLILYFILAYTISKIIHLVNKELRLTVGAYIDQLSYKAVFLLPFFTLFLVGIGYLGLGINSVFWGVIPLAKLVFYSQFFAFGVLLHWRKNLIHKFTHIPLRKTSLLMAFLVTCNSFLELNSFPLTMIIHKYIDILVIWLSCALCFTLLKKMADKPSKTLLFISNASYTVYLFHHLLVIVFGLIFIRFGIGGYWGLVGLIAAVLSASTLIHYFVISRSNWLHYMFNGKRLDSWLNDQESSLGTEST